ncbi:unnamed protein product, partial [Mesorhabditis belari]|uniref:7TM GPCR serpentine receptor class x (Srx) domain-containing protein n=1 Tax=Mesorhabditis belari TaxID=2138241 RepID=A0AAF3EM14_9BILA
MATGVLHYGLSALISFVIFSMLSINITVIYFFVRGRLYKSTKNPLYAILMYNICCGTAQNLTHIFFVLPLVILQKPIIPKDSTTMAFLAVWFLHLWYNATFVHIIMAVNRVSAICWKEINAYFTLKNIFLMLITITCLGVGTSLYTQHYSPCCRIYFEPITYGYMYMPNHGKNLSYNFSQLIIDLPMEFAVSIICISSYIWVFLYIYRMKQKAELKDRSHRREIMCCIQCCLVFSFYSFTWASFHIMPRLGFTTLEPFAFTTIVYNIDCGINSIVLIINNEEVRRQMKSTISKVTAGRYDTSCSKKDESNISHSHIDH